MLTLTGLTKRSKAGIVIAGYVCALGIGLVAAWIQHLATANAPKQGRDVDAFRIGAIGEIGLFGRGTTTCHIISRRVAKF